MSLGLYGLCGRNLLTAEIAGDFAKFAKENPPEGVGRNAGASRALFERIGKETAAGIVPPVVFRRSIRLWTFSLIAPRVAGTS